MEIKYYIQIITIFSLLFLTNSLDNSTLSNYQTIKLVHLSGIFEPDFKEKIVYGNLTYNFTANLEGEEIKLDTKNLEILKVTYETGEELNYTFDESEENESLGMALNIHSPFKEGENVVINIQYKTTESGRSAQFLTKSQTYGKEYEYFFTMSEMILGRELLPSQDTPAVKFPFYLGIKVPKPLRGMISGIYINETEDGNTTTFYYEQKIPVPNYLIALAAGNIKERIINENISVFSEPEFVNKAYEELVDFLPKILELAISYMGDYEWGKYNVLVLPDSFPYSGMENPCLTFSSPCLINGDKSLVDIVAHELIHSWSGNLVTNENWRDFWLNEGITMFLQRKIISMWKNEDYAKMDGILGLFYIEEYLDYFGEDSNYTSLRPDLTGISPDEIYSDIPYEKGYNLMYYIETLIGNETMKNFFQSYFQHFKNKSLDVFDFRDYFTSFCKENGVDEETLNKIEWDKWLYEPGACPVENDFSNKYQVEVDETLKNFSEGKLDGLSEEIGKWTHTQKTVFMNTLEQKDNFLTKDQHNFITNTLQLYDDNFLVKTNYFRLILARTDEFYEIEKEKLIEYLSSYGAVDYMTGIYGLLYQRDEELAVRTLESLRGFYHSVMIEEAEYEFEDAQKNFPLLTLDLKGQCSFLSLDTKIGIITEEEFKDTFKNVTVEKGVYLTSKESGDDSNTELQCYLDKKEKYCQIKKKMEKSGNYKLTVPSRIQNLTYAIKKNEGKNTMQIYLKEIIIDTNKTNKTFEINYYNEKEKKIQIFFKSEPDENISIKHDEKYIEYKKVNETVIEIIINSTIFDYDKEGAEGSKEYTVKIFDPCGKEKYSFVVKALYEGVDDDDVGIVAILIIIIIGLLVVIIVSFFIYRSVNRRKNIDIGQVDEKKLLSEI